MEADEKFRMPLCFGINIEEATILELQKLLSKKEISSVELTRCYLKRIDLVNPYTKSVIEPNPDALSIAKQLDDERASDIVRGPLHGIPFLVKDNIATKDRMQTTAGSSILIGSVVPHDAHVVHLLRAAGAVLIGHANMSEWASIKSTYYSEGFSSRGGQCRNPYNLENSPGGSSSGSAGAVATNMCAFSLGTETDGSVVLPADLNGVVGIKPTVGTTSRYGVIPESESLDTVGVFGRTVLDAALALDAIAAKDESTKFYQGPPGGFYFSYLGKKSILNLARFGVPSKRIWDAAEHNQKYNEEYSTLRSVIDKLAEAGAEIINVDLPSAEQIISADGWNWDYPSHREHPEKSEFTVVATEFYDNLKKYLSLLDVNPHHIYGLEDVIAWNKKHTQLEGGIPNTHPAWPLGQDSFDSVLELKGERNQAYRAALEFIRQKSREEGIDAALRVRDSMLDGLLVPLRPDGGVACQVAAKAGYPMISIPVGINKHGVPLSIGIIHTAWHEHILIKYGSAIEDLLCARRKPTFLNLHATNYPYVGRPRK